MLKKMLLVVATSVALLSGTAAADPRTEIIPPSLDGENCPTGTFQRSTGPFVFEYRFLSRYTPNGGLVWLGKYYVRYKTAGTDWRDVRPPDREYLC